MTVTRAMEEAAGLMEGAGLENTFWQAKVLAAHLLDKSPSQLMCMDKLSFSPGKEEIFFTLVSRRIAGEPLQYLIGNWDFFGRNFLVEPSALIPRPETELLAETVLLSSLPPSPLILDVGTGTGVIGITLALEIPGATVIATDISPGAADLAKRNARRLNADNFLVTVCHLAEPISLCFDVLTANLPYIPSGDIDSLPAVVRNHDPHSALDGGESGISLILELVKGASRLVKPGGLIVLETGSDQETSVSSLFSSGYWQSVKAHRDLAGNHRLVTAVRSLSGI